MARSAIEAIVAPRARRVMPLCVAALCCAVTSTAAAQEADPANPPAELAPTEEQGDTQAPPPDEAARILALVKNANDEFDRGEYEDALRLYRRAYKAYPQPVLLYRIGVAAEKSGEKREAIEAYQMFVDASDEGDPTAAKTVQRIEELKASIPPQVTVTSTPAGADIFLRTVDSEPLGTTPATVEIPTGEQTLLVRLEGYKLARETVNIPGGEAHDLAVELAPLERLAVVEEGAAVKATDTESAFDLGLWGWIAGGAGVAMLGTGAVFSALSASATNDVNTYDKRAPGASRAELAELKEKATSYHENSIPLYVTGGIFAATGVVLILLDNLRDEPQGNAVRLDVTPVPGGGSVSVFGRF